MADVESRVASLETAVADLQEKLTKKSPAVAGEGFLLVNDTLIQWGGSSTSQNNYVTVTFPKPFSDVPAVVASINTTQGGDFDYITVKDPTPTTFTFFGVRPPMAGGPPSSVPGNIPVSWLAVGKKAIS